MERSMHEQVELAEIFERSGLQFYARMPKEEWENWIPLFQNKASKILGYEVGESERE